MFQTGAHTLRIDNFFQEEGSAFIPNTSNAISRRAAAFAACTRRGRPSRGIELTGHFACRSERTTTICDGVVSSKPGYSAPTRIFAQGMTYVEGMVTGVDVGRKRDCCRSAMG